jgi:hypothetical protein
MIDKDTLTRIKSVFSDAVKKLRDGKTIPDDFVGSFQINCNSGGVTRVDANIPIK